MRSRKPLTALHLHERERGPSTDKVHYVNLDPNKRHPLATPTLTQPRPISSKGPDPLQGSARSRPTHHIVRLVKSPVLSFWELSIDRLNGLSHNVAGNTALFAGLFTASMGG